MSRPERLPVMATLVVWRSRVLTLAEAVVWYHDWALDQGGADGSYISHASMAQRLGDKVAEGTVSRIRQRLKRLTLHEPIRRVDARNLGWVSTLPIQCVPRVMRDVPGMAAALDTYLERLTRWSSQSGRESLDSLDASVQPEQTPVSDLGAAALGGRGEVSTRSSVRQAQLPPAVREKGEGAHTPRRRESRRTVEEPPMNTEELRAYFDSLEKDVKDGRLTQNQADMLRRVSGL